MTKTPEIIKIGNYFFKYDYKHAIVSRVVKATDEARKDNEHWIAKYGKPLWDIDEEGFIEIASVGLSRENWENKAIRDEYLSEWIYELDAETSILCEDFIKNELADYQNT